MNTSTIHYGTETANRQAGLIRVTANHGKWRTGICLLCALLATAGALSARAAAEATYKLFGREVGGYASKDDLPGIVGKELGLRASIADWEEIKKQYGQSEADLKAFCQKLGLATNSTAWVTLGGKRFWQNERHYFVYRADHKLPGDFMLHDQLRNNFLLLGSWYETRPVLVKITDYNASDAAKFAKWDGMLAAHTKAAAAGSKGVAGVYSLVTVNGQKLPARVTHEGAALEVRSGVFTIAADGKCNSKMTFVPPSGSLATVETTATYSREGQKLDMQWQGAGRTTGTIEGNTFTMENEGMVFAYRK
jgi:hypothetical protein